MDWSQPLRIYQVKYLIFGQKARPNSNPTQNGSYLKQNAVLNILLIIRFYILLKPLSCSIDCTLSSLPIASST